MSLDGSREALEAIVQSEAGLVLDAFAPSPVVRVNRTVAVGRERGPEACLALLAALEDGDGARRLADYQPYHAARADLLRCAGRSEEAAAAYRIAIDLCRAEPERRFLAGRLGGLTAWIR